MPVFVWGYICLLRSEVSSPKGDFRIIHNTATIQLGSEVGGVSLPEAHPGPSTSTYSQVQPVSSAYSQFFASSQALATELTGN